RGAIVINPDIQLFALPTHNTPLQNTAIAEAATDSFNDNMQFMLDAIHTRKISDLLELYWIAESSANGRTTDISVERIVQKHDSEFNRVGNQQLMLLHRGLQLQLYSSTNFKDFTAFSA